MYPKSKACQELQMRLAYLPFNVAAATSIGWRCDTYKQDACSWSDVPLG